MTDIQKELSGIIETYCNELIGADVSAVKDYSFSEKYLKRKHELISQMGSPKRGGIRLKVIIALIAAVLALAVPVGTYAYNTFIHKKNVELFLNNADDLDRFAVNHVMENEHLRRTVDIMLSDGHNVLTVETQEYKDDIGEQFVRSIIQGYHLMTYTDAVGSPSASHGHSSLPCVGMASTLAVTDNTDERSCGRISSIYSCEGIDLDKELRITYFANGDRDMTAAEQYFGQRYPELDRYGGAHDGAADNWLEGFEYVTSFAPNVECVTLHSDDGTEIVMSQFEIFSERKGAGETIRPSSHTQYSFILKNGEKREFLQNNSCGGEGYRTFGEVIDLDDYAGVEIAGVEYLR